jgi:hypothetical protein
MITKVNLEIYKKYKGDGDMFVRCKTKLEQDLIDNGDFGLIDDLLQNMEIVDNGLASQSFIDKLTMDLRDNVAPDCVDLLKQLEIKR